MNKYKMVSYLFVLLGVIVIVGAAYFIISYSSDILGSIVNFVTTNDFTKLQQCGINTPAQFSKIRTDLTTVILPFMYVGIPLLLIIVSALMFMAGVYYHKGKFEDEAKKHEEMEREMVHKLVQRMGKPAAPPATEEEPEAPPAEEMAPPKEETSAEEEAPPEEPPEEVPKPPPAKSSKKRK
jgi:uncharacterized protein YneF (UPF0154 family)